MFAATGMRDATVFEGGPPPAAMPWGHEDGRHMRDAYRAAGMSDGAVIASARDVVRFYARRSEAGLLRPASLGAPLRDVASAGYGLGIEVDGAVAGHGSGDAGFRRTCGWAGSRARSR